MNTNFIECQTKNRALIPIAVCLSRQDKDIFTCVKNCKHSLIFQAKKLKDEEKKQKKIERVEKEKEAEEQRKIREEKKQLSEEKKQKKKRKKHKKKKIKKTK